MPRLAPLVASVVLVGAMVGQERSVVPLLARDMFGLESFAAALTFILTFGSAKAATNFVAGRLLDRLGRRPVLVSGWLIGLPVPLLLGGAHEGLVGRLRAAFGDRPVLLVLDNLEQVEGMAALVSGVLRSMPLLRVLATSRSPLRVQGEQEYPVPPLGLPDTSGDAPQALLRSEAGSLFVDRARSVNPSFSIDESNAEDVSRLIARLDGLPLAIELAASRVKLFTPRMIADSVEQSLDLLAGGPVDLPLRQRTLRAAIGWSYDQLDPLARRLLDALSLFSAAEMGEIEQLCSQIGISPLDSLEAIATLVDHSLLRLTGTDPARFDLLETIRSFVGERLEESGQGRECRDAHAAMFLRLSEAAAPHREGPDQAQWLQRLEREVGNLRSAFGWFLETAPEQALDISASLWRFWFLHRH